MTKESKPVDLRQLMQSGFETARKIVLSGQEAMPVFLAQWGSGHIAVYATPWANDEQKELALRIMRLLFAARKVQRYAFIAEAWMLEVPATVKFADAPRPSKHPNRIEVLNIVGVEEGAVIGARALLGKDQDGNRTCSDLEYWDAGSAQGRMTELLPDSDWPTPPPGTAEMLEEKFGIKSEAFTVH